MKINRELQHYCNNFAITIEISLRRRKRKGQAPVGSMHKIDDQSSAQYRISICGQWVPNPGPKLVLVLRLIQ